MNEMATAPLLGDTSIGLLMVKSLGMLLLVLGILIGVLYLLKRMSQSRAGLKDKTMIRHMSTFYMAPKERVVLLDVMGRKILIGVTPQSITHIADLDHIQGEDHMPVEARGQDSAFRNLLKRLSREPSQADGAEPPTLHKAGVSS